MDIRRIFNKFAGREVPMTEVSREVDVGGRKFPVNEIHPVNKNDPTLKEMQQEAEKHGLRLRVFWPGTVSTMDYRTDRVNATIEKQSDGKWRVGKQFSIG